MALSLVLVLQAIVVAAMAFKVYHHKERLVIVPPMALESGRPLELAWNNANQEYIKSFALYLSCLIGNITPQNVQFIADSIGSYLSPEIYPDIRVKLLAIAQDDVWVKSSQTTFFAPREIIYEEQTQRVFVVGESNSVGFRTAVDKKSMIYEMMMTIREGRPTVTYLSVYEGTQPRTLKWLLNQPEDVKAKYKWILDKAKVKEK